MDPFFASLVIIKSDFVPWSKVFEAGVVVSCRIPVTTASLGARGWQDLDITWKTTSEDNHTVLPMETAMPLHKEPQKELFPPTPAHCLKHKPYCISLRQTVSKSWAQWVLVSSSALFSQLLFPPMPFRVWNGLFGLMVGSNNCCGCTWDPVFGLSHLWLGKYRQAEGSTEKRSWEAEGPNPRGCCWDLNTQFYSEKTTVMTKFCR